MTLITHLQQYVQQHPKQITTPPYNSMAFQWQSPRTLSEKKIKAKLWPIYHNSASTPFNHHKPSPWCKSTSKQDDDEQKQNTYAGKCHLPLQEA